ncbi:histone-lysine N-methyltransferase SETMAR-like [Sipha flava]|uniref:Histone-lysine N-methyltransferase SETMAR-like n=1 Tax=Sipha flava TaxID=143950 RepID=A0A8B8G1A4_9HEMI|nr:histone-lysine N-methyltransferase SETMAR-like [Sipha flava]
MSLKNVRKWCREFSGGRTEIHDEQRSGRPSISDKLKEQIERELREDRRVTVRDLEQRFELSKSIIQRFFNDMGYHKCCARWVPKMLTEDHKRQRIETSREFCLIMPNKERFFLTP